MNANGIFKVPFHVKSTISIFNNCSKSFCESIESTLSKGTFGNELFCRNSFIKGREGSSKMAENCTESRILVGWI